MAKPRIFISSTYYDLKQTREDIADFVQTLGYEAVRNEEGNIPYGKEKRLEEYCYKEVQNIDIFISIIGGRFGSESQNGKYSISNEELKTALHLNKQVYICIEKNVFSDYETYALNKNNNEIHYRYVDNPKNYQFIGELKGLTSNNNIMSFDTSADIKAYLKEQFAGLFRSFLAEQAKAREMELAVRLENTSKTLEHLVDYLKETNKDKEEGISKLLKINHPFVNHLEETLNINFNIWIENLDELKSFLSTLGWLYAENDNNDTSTDDYLWTLPGSDPWENTKELRISKKLFDNNGNLLDIKTSEWQSNYISLDDKSEETTIAPATDAVSTISDDLPF